MSYFISLFCTYKPFVCLWDLLHLSGLLWWSQSSPVIAFQDDKLFNYICKLISEAEKWSYRGFRGGRDLKWRIWEHNKKACDFPPTANIWRLQVEMIRGENSKWNKGSWLISAVNFCRSLVKLMAKFWIETSSKLNSKVGDVERKKNGPSTGWDNLLE